MALFDELKINRHIDHAMWLPSAGFGLPANFRTRVLEQMALPRGRIYTEATPESEGRVHTADDAVELFERILDRDNERVPLTLIIAPGRLEGGWDALIRGTFGAVLQRTHPKRAAAILENIDPIIRGVCGIHDQLNEVQRVAPWEELQGTYDALFEPRVVGQKLLGNLSALGPVIAEIQRRLILLMLTNGQGYRYQGSVAEHAMLIDGAFDATAAIADINILISHVRTALIMRGLTDNLPVRVAAGSAVDAKS